MPQYLICCYSDSPNDSAKDAKGPLLAAVGIHCPAKHVAETLVDKVRELIRARYERPDDHLGCHIGVFPESDAVVHWNPVDLALAQRRQELWRQSDGAQQSRPDSILHAFLQECGETAKFLPAIALPAPKPTAEQRKDKAMKSTAEWMLTFARAVEILKKTFDDKGIVAKYTELERQLRHEGWNPETNRLNKDLSENDYIRAIVSKLKGRPPKSSKKYDEWKEDFDMSVRFAFEALLKNDRDGIDAKDLLKEYTVKKKLLTGTP